MNTVLQLLTCDPPARRKARPFGEARRRAPDKGASTGLPGSAWERLMRHGQRSALDP
jgi:hypothetical protein